MKKRRIVIAPILACIILACCGTLQSCRSSTETDSGSAKEETLQRESESKFKFKSESESEDKTDAYTKNKNEDRTGERAGSERETAEETGGQTVSKTGKETGGQGESETAKETGGQTVSETRKETGGQGESETKEETGDRIENGLERETDSENENEAEDGFWMDPEISDDFDAVRSVPVLPETGTSLHDFIPQGWEMIDRAALDYNGDEMMDYVAVLEPVYMTVEADSNRLSPRILFGVYCEGDRAYRLDFQDVNLIRARSEGGVFGDPYVPMTSEGQSFTIRSYGGSAWRWWEARTFTWSEGEWYLTMDESGYGYGDYITDYAKDDYEKKTGLRQKRSDEFTDIEKNWDRLNRGEMEYEEIPFDLTYEISLEEPPTLEQAGMRWWLAPDRMNRMPVEQVELGEGVKLSPEQIKLPKQVGLFDSQDENMLLYHFLVEGRGQSYIALYRIQEKTLLVLKGDDMAHFNEVVGLYQGQIYYTANAWSSDFVGKTEVISEQEDSGDGQDGPGADDDVVGMELYRMDLDGTNRQPIFGWRLPEEEWESSPYLALNCEFGKDELVIEVYRGDAPHPFYRISPDGQEKQFLGQVPQE